MKQKKEENMIQAQVGQSFPLPLPSKKRTRNVQGDVDLELFTAVQKEMAAKNVKLVQVLEWGLSAYLLRSNPKAAAELGITGDDKK